MDNIRNWIRHATLKNALLRTEKSYKRYQLTNEYKKMDPNEKHNKDEEHYFSGLSPILEEVREMETNILINKLEFLKIPYITKWCKESDKYWEQGHYGYYYLNKKGVYEYNKLIREEQKARRDMIIGWIPVITALTGVLGAITAILTIVKYWK